ncbi:MAG TPA: N-acetyl-gamma-glutamyl-phosphate reductase [Candidatus Binataceae bacterium]|jgi:N-acetyl-gamma-glutamyl-phosphate reductase|nr:N-acetyl-gamma-glutamyl-phosphate reductase [Candidatus Binataceae bacterium]
MASHNNRIKLAVLGASGYSGIEAVRLLAGHPFVELSALTSEHFAGREVAEVYRHLAGIDLPPFEELRADLIRGRAEVVVSCLPERVGAALIGELVGAGLKVIDLSADFRLKDPAQYRQTYGVDHPAPALLKEAVYGLAEFHRRELREARLVAVPGCYPTSALLGILPLIRRDLVDPSSIVIDSKSGTTGARRAPQIEQLFAEVNENFRAYKVGNHRHVPEMEQEIGAALGREVAVMFVPHLLPVTRGILTSIFMRPRAGTSEEDVRAAFEAAFAKSRFVRLLKPGELPELKNVRATNFCELGFVLERRSQTLCVLSAIDNLGKGAAGQAIQDLNLMLGHDEAAGLLGAAPVP